MGSIALGSCFRIARSYLSCKREFFWKFVAWHSSELELEAGRKVLFTSPIIQSLIPVRNTFSSNNSANSDPLPLDSVTQALGSAATVVGRGKKISHSCGQPNTQSCLPPKSVNVLLCRETSTTKEVLAIVWAQGHCKSFPKINLATALHRIAILSSQADCTQQLRDDLFRHKAFHYLLTVMKEGIPKMSMWSIGIALWSFGRLQYIPSTHPTLIEDLIKALAKPENRASVTDREVALCVWGLGTLGLQPEPSLMPCYEELICHTLHESMRKGSTGPVKSFCQILSGLAKNDQVLQPETKAVLLRAAEFCLKMDEKSTVTVMWSARKLQLPISEASWAIVDAHTCRRAHKHDAAALVSLFFSYSAMRRGRSQSAVQALCSAFSEKLSTMSDIHLASGLQVISSMKGDVGDKFIAAVAEKLMARVRDGGLSADAIANVLTYLWQAQQGGRVSVGIDLLEDVWDSLQRVVSQEELSATTLGGCLWGLALWAKLGSFPRAPTIAACARRLKAALPTAPIPSVAVAMWALSVLRWYDPELLDSTSQLLEKRLQEGALRSIPPANRTRVSTQFITSFAFLGHASPAVVPLAEGVAATLLGGEMVHGHRNHIRQTVTTTLWGLAMLRLLHEPVVDELSNLCNELLSPDSSPEDDVLGEHLVFARCQVFHAHLAASLQPGSRLSLSGPLLDACRVTWKTTTLASNSSAYQAEVFRELKEIVPHAELEKLTDDGMFSIDIGFRDADGRAIAVEVDGPVHYASSHRSLSLRTHSLRNELLAHRGYVVVSVPMYMWRKEANKQQLLRRLLTDAGVTLPAR